VFFHWRRSSSSCGFFPDISPILALDFPPHSYGLTLEGQYIIKNLVLIGAGIVLGGTVRGGQLVPERLEGSTSKTEVWPDR
jgi:hypothetical protein